MKLLMSKFMLFTIFNVLFVFTVFPSISCGMELQINKNSEYASVREKSLIWLNKQIVPNSAVTSPPADRKKLILSYEFAETNPAYRELFSKSSLYDNAVAVIALCIERHFELAAKIVEGIIRMGGEDGELFFTFNTHNSWPSKKDNFGAIVRSGASAWAGQAIVFYLKAKMLLEENILLNDSTVQGYLKYAELIADNMLKRMILDKDDERYGLITGGKGRYVLKHNTENNTIEETFEDGEVRWCSIEHNIDMYFFLKDLGEISADSKYSQSAQLMRNALLTKCWNEERNQFNRGQHLLGSDTVMALDCASWGALFLKSNNEQALMQKCLKSVENYESALGYRPYVEKEIYETYDVGKFYFPENPKLSWNELDFMWTEGALGAALAYVRAGDRFKAEDIVKQVLKYISNSGGIRYASKYIPHEFSSEPSVASTGWLIMVLGDLEDNEIAKLFWN